MKNSQVEVSWEYPDSWSTPHSYFSLKFFVRIQRKKEKTKETEEECNQVGLNAARVGDNGNILTTRYLLQEQNCVRALYVNHTQPTQRPEGSQYCRHLYTEKDGEAQGGYGLPKFTHLEQ